MPMGSRDRLLDQLRRVALHGMGERRTDGQLLEHFITQRDEVAFAALLKRHGPMVRSVCQSVIGNPHDADDVFQATFLVLVRKAASVRPREAVGNFLYGVAYRTALEARGRIARRRAKETTLWDVPQPESKSSEMWQELRPLLDRELNRLSEKFRLPVVLCDLEGRSRKEVAQQLAIPEGTLSSRLATARKKLAARLTRYGYALPSVSLAALLAENAASACLPASLLAVTSKAALLVAAGPMAAAGIVSVTVNTLTEGVLKTMFIAKIKTATAVLFGVTVLSLGTGGVIYQTRVGAAGSPQEGQIGQEQPKARSKAEPEKDKWRQIAEEARKREEILTRELQIARRELADLKAMMQKQRSAEEDERQRAAKRLDLRTKEAETTLRKRVEVDANKTPDRKQEVNSAVEPLERERDQLIRQMTNRLKVLQAQRQQLEADQKQLGDEMKKRVGQIDEMIVRIKQQQTANRPNSRAVHKPAGGDKLDQILQHLERLEKRLDRLERGGK